MDVEKTAVRAKILPVVTGVAAVHEFERAGAVAEGTKGERGAGGRVFIRGRHFCLPAHFVIHAGFFHAQDTQLAPASGDHVVDEGFFEGGLRLEFLVKGGEEVEETGFGLAFEDYRARERAGRQGVLGGGGFTLRRAGGLDLTFGSHTTLVVAWEWGEFAGLGGGALIRGEIYVFGRCYSKVQEPDFGHG